MTARQVEYQEFLKSDFWKGIREDVLKRDGCKCLRCGACDTELNVHHLRYREDFYDLPLEDLITLCRECHRKEHGIVEVKLVEKPKPQEPPKDEKRATIAILRNGALIARSMYEALKWRQRGRITRQEYLKCREKLGWMLPPKHPKPPKKRKCKPKPKPQKRHYASLAPKHDPWKLTKPYKSTWHNKGSSSN